MLGSVVFKRVCFRRLFADSKAVCVVNTCGRVVHYRVYHPMETRRRVLFLEKKRQNSAFRSEAFMVALDSFLLHAGAGQDVNSRRTSIILFVLSADRRPTPSDPTKKYLQYSIIPGTSSCRYYNNPNNSTITIWHNTFIFYSQMSWNSYRA